MGSWNFTKLRFSFATICTKAGWNHVQVGVEVLLSAHDSKRSFYSSFLQVKKTVSVVFFSGEQAKIKNNKYLCGIWCTLVSCSWWYHHMVFAETGEQGLLWAWPWDFHFLSIKKNWCFKLFDAKLVNPAEVFLFLLCTYAGYRMSHWLRSYYDYVSLKGWCPVHARA